MKIKIIYEDEAIIIVHKPSGIATQTDRMGQSDVVSELKNYLAKSGKDTYVGIVHRLDQPVEGLLVFARDKKSAAVLSKQITEGTLKKYYLALVCGTPVQPEGVLVNKLVKCSGNISTVADNLKDEKLRQQAKEAKLQYRCCHTKTFGEGQTYSLMEIELFTGRHHQIRVQMAYYQMPLLGDKKYGSEQALKLSEAMQITQTALFAYRLILRHPKTGKRIEFALEMPESWQ